MGGVDRIGRLAQHRPDALQQRVQLFSASLSVGECQRSSISQAHHGDGLQHQTFLSGQTICVQYIAGVSGQGRHIALQTFELEQQRAWIASVEHQQVQHGFHLRLTAVTTTVRDDALGTDEQRFEYQRVGGFVVGGRQRDAQQLS